MSKLSRWVDRHVTHKSEKKEKIREMEATISDYKKEQNELLKEREGLQKDRREEKRKADEKKLKFMRSHLRAPGFLEEANTDLNERLG